MTRRGKREEKASALAEELRLSEGPQLPPPIVAIVGRPNVGKSTLVNRLVGEKVSITAATPNTTRHAVRGVVHLDGAQLVLVDTPGLHRPKSALGHRLNDRQQPTCPEQRRGRRFQQQRHPSWRTAWNPKLQP